MTRLQAAARKGYWKEDDARVVVEAWRRSGWSMGRFARARGVHPARLSRWVKRLVDGVTEEEPAFHPVRIVEGKQPEARELVVELVSGVRVRVPAGFLEEDLRRVLVALGE